MNPVFWLLVILGLGLIWWMLTPLFRRIGRSSKSAIDKTKKEIFEDEETERKN